MVNNRGSLNFVDGWQKHHLIPKHCMNDPETSYFWGKLYNIGFVRDDFGSNGILLPTTYADSEKYGLPYHSGSHTKYNREVTNGLRLLATGFGFFDNPTDAHDALIYVRTYQARLRTGMAQNRPIQ